jgi:hypothetical protein
VFKRSALIRPTLANHRLVVEFAGGRHAVMERDRIEVESVGPGKCSKFHEDACEERRVFERAHHLSVARRRR